MPQPLPFDQQTVDIINKAQKAVGDDYTAGLIDAMGHHIQPVAWQASPFQEQAATRATRLLRQAGPNMQMENDPRYKMNMLGQPPDFNAMWDISSPKRKLQSAVEMVNSRYQRGQ